MGKTFFTSYFRFLPCHPSHLFNFISVARTLACLHLHNSSRLFIFSNYALSGNCQWLIGQRGGTTLARYPWQDPESGSRKASHKNISPNNKKWKEPSRNNKTLEVMCHPQSPEFRFVLFRTAAHIACGMFVCTPSGYKAHIPYPIPQTP